MCVDGMLKFNEAIGFDKLDDGWIWMIDNLEKGRPSRNTKFNHPGRCNSDIIQICQLNKVAPRKIQLIWFILLSFA